MLKTIFWALIIIAVYSLIGAVLAFLFLGAAFYDMPMAVTVGIIWPVALFLIAVSIVVTFAAKLIRKVIHAIHHLIF